MIALADFLSRAERRGELRFLLIGGRSLEAHGFVRNTKDVDLLIASNHIPEMERLLGIVGYEKIVETDIFSRWKHRSFGAEDVDVMFVTASTFDALARDAVEFPVGSVTLRVPSIRAIAALKIHAIQNNPERFSKDGGDVLRLKELHPDQLPIEDLETLCKTYGTDELWSKLKTLLA